MTALLEATKRDNFRKSALAKIRKEGNIPAVVYGKTFNGEAIAINSMQLLKTLQENGRNGVISLSIQGDKHNVVLQDYQEDHLKNEIVHADFLEVDLSSEITAPVRVNLVGTAAGVKDGGVLQQPLFEINITAKVSDMPDEINVDVSNLQVEEVISVGDIKDQFNFEFNHEDSETIVSILAPRQEEEIDSGEEQEPGVPDREEGRE
ncbi:large subunit ribosomal protein L25 [Oikeobacillus pervagus]|uniref:Large ribosomal subunit protein bL25 n=1 Tax=Oikeobacillus pervagus TaxID=1325931 RepID=A0AAJ1WLH2_9BACI|nr:50S ribosomal protein L25/general stress protein Ctc [Oikeobacillus pervagus]MDQ0216196.1 large subunit ribosomal protein L25 [Oikeobacillus pervagus]